MSSVMFTVVLQDYDNKQEALKWCTYQHKNFYKNESYYYDVSHDFYENSLDEFDKFKYDIVFYFSSSQFAVAFKLMGF